MEIFHYDDIFVNKVCKAITRHGTTEASVLRNYTLNISIKFAQCAWSFTPCTTSVWHRNLTAAHASGPSVCSSALSVHQTLRLDLCHNRYDRFVICKQTTSSELRVVFGERAKGHVESSRVCGPTLKHVGLPGSKTNTSLFQVQPSPEVPAPMYSVAMAAVKHFFFSTKRL